MGWELDIIKRNVVINNYEEGGSTKCFGFTYFLKP